MNQQSPLTILFVVVTLLAGLLVTLSVLTGGGNEIGHLCKFMLVAVAVFGLINPRNGIYLLLFICAYIDTLKRLMVVSGRVSQLDLYYVLGIPPTLLSACAASVIISIAVGKLELRGRQWTLLFVAAGFMGINAGMSYVGGNRSLGGLLPVVANGGLYALLLFLIPVLFQEREDIERLIKRTIWIFVPVAIYGVFQKIFGYQQFEIDYLLTGISIEIKQLVGDDLRPFSTLNSNTALTTVCGFLAAVSFTAMFIRRSDQRRPLIIPALALPLSVIFFAGIVASTGRSGFAVGFFTLLGCWCFKSRKATLSMYVGIVTLFIFLVVFSRQLIDMIGPLQLQINSVVGDGRFAEQLTRIGTYTDRLAGYYNLMSNPAIWTLFGHDNDAWQDNSLYSHDVLTGALVKHGVVPVFLISLMAAFCLLQLHRTILRITDRSLLAIAAAMTAIMLSSLLASLLFGSVMGVFPINVLIFTAGGILMLARQLHDQQSVPSAEELFVSETVPPDPVRKVRIPFRRSGKIESV
ncbi:hypothetical protein FEM03_11360 [Phragmitibacter flavus]|uniref:O-antigen ligase family protein n=1 Tax=Phragmitibacter flavus TaxID=2576071 RepID=A0A5R8KG08_9BACT|nr:hypothetical protein [Phragmitibacter flavus]TLD70895.1 hypothetical protein FEM03_11360 [Phragmitibacter flavus]